MDEGYIPSGTRITACRLCGEPVREVGFTLSPATGYMPEQRTDRHFSCGCTEFPGRRGPLAVWPGQWNHFLDLKKAGASELISHKGCSSLEVGIMKIGAFTDAGDEDDGGGQKEEGHSVVLPAQRIESLSCDLIVDIVDEVGKNDGIRLTSQQAGEVLSWALSSTPRHPVVHEALFPATTREEQTVYLTRWADQNGCRFRDRGFIGFGRECTGITHEGDLHPAHYVVYDPESSAAPPVGVRAYRKNDCLATLGHGDEAIADLYRWVRRLEMLGYTVTERLRLPQAANQGVDIELHGKTEPILVREG